MDRATLKAVLEEFNLSVGKDPRTRLDVLDAFLREGIEVAEAPPEPKGRSVPRARSQRGSAS